MSKTIALIRAAFAYDSDLVSHETGLLCEDESLTVQSDKEDCDINTLVKRFGITGELPSNVRIPLDGEFANVKDFHSAMNLLVEAREGFMELPADVRSRFDHDPGKFVAFCSDEKNLEEARKLGVALPEKVLPVVEPIQVRVVEAPKAP